jgi:hypothetical protein
MPAKPRHDDDADGDPLPDDLRIEFAEVEAKRLSEENARLKEKLEYWRQRLRATLAKTRDALRSADALLADLGDMRSTPPAAKAKV